MEIREELSQVDGLPVRRLVSGGDATGALFVHGVPTSSDQWRPFLERVPGIALDLPGFGRSGKPADFGYSIDGYAGFLERFVDDLGLERLSLVMHDWGGGLGLALAQRIPERVKRLVLIDAVPLLPGYRWHRVARTWRRPLLGELLMGFTSRFTMKRGMRRATASPGPPPPELLDMIWRHFDHGTQRAILKLYRSAPPDALARAGDRLGELRCPALVLWGRDDPYLPDGFADAYSGALGGETEVEKLERAGHWPWLDRPEVVDRVVDFIAGRP